MKNHYEKHLWQMLPKITLILILISINGCGSREENSTSELKESQDSFINENYVIYKGEQNEVLFVLYFKLRKYIARRGKAESPLEIEVVGLAGVGATKKEAKDNLTEIKTKKDSKGETVIYFEQKKRFKGIKTFYLLIEINLLYGNRVTLAEYSLKELGFLNEWNG